MALARRGRGTRRLALAGALLLAAGGLPAHAAGAEGHSLFAELVGASGEVPFPLERLLARLRGQVDPASEFGGLPIVLIPLGRSLQRHAAGDDGYFRYPRVVVAVTGEPASPAAPLYKDRLYLGYHEKAAVLEVISYNEAAGRFEFEIVDDYRAGGRPRLRAGRRAMCLACHQNAAPIFSRQSWDETSANRSVAALLELAGRDFYGLAWRRGVDVANAIDDASDRANLLAVAQRVWREGCGGADEAALSCRARLLRLALRARLAAQPVAEGELAHADLAPLAATWRSRWGGALAVPNPDLPNRQPFAALAEGATVLEPAALRRLADVAARFDALELRPPLEHWRIGEAGRFAQMIRALGLFFADAELRALEAALAVRPPAATRRLELACELRRRQSRTDLDCRDAAGALLSGRLEAGRLRVDRLGLDRGETRYGLEFATAGAGRFAARGAALRSRAGEALRAVELDGSRLALELVDDLAPLDAAIDRLAAESAAGRSDALGELPLRRAAVLAPLLAGFGIEGPRPAAASPVAAAEAPALAHAGVPALAPFYRHCAACHDSSEAFPPGFLRGDRASVEARLDACAPRMLQRLAMLDLPPAQRPKTPMPPPAAAQAEGLRGTADLAAMREWLGGRLRAAGTEPDIILRQPYAALPDCAIYRMPPESRVAASLPPRGQENQGRPGVFLGEGAR